MKVNIYNIKKNGRRKYAHFDERVGLKEVYGYVSDSEKIAKHNFYPFIYYEKKTCKFNNKSGKKEKVRPICYASHIDRCIYQLYSHFLNNKYNEKCKELEIDECSIAYRDNKKMSNINFAKDVFDFIKRNKCSYIIVGDFKGFFDNLNHDYLKKKLCELLDVNILSNDLYAIYKSMTKYSKCNLKDILSFKGLSDTYNDIKKLNSYDSVMNVNEFKNFKKKHLIKNTNDYGIPQGASLSGVFSNIYMTEFDCKMKKITNLYNGLYRRYSDDFILVLSNIDIDKFKNIFVYIIDNINNTPGVEIEKEKTKCYFYNEKMISNITKILVPEIKEDKCIIDYLGFSFNGEEISIRDKTYGKYIYRMRKKIDVIEKNKGYTRKGNRISYDEVYEKYSKKGLKFGSNFITYVKLANKVFNDEKKISNIELNHMNKIAKTIKEKRKKYE